MSDGGLTVKVRVQINEKPVNLSNELLGIITDYVLAEYFKEMKK